VSITCGASRLVSNLTPSSEENDVIGDSVLKIPQIDKSMILEYRYETEMLLTELTSIQVLTLMPSVAAVKKTNNNQQYMILIYHIDHLFGETLTTNA
jgi:hypothetical protein